MLAEAVWGGVVRASAVAFARLGTLGGRGTFGSFLPPQQLPEPTHDPAEVRDLADEILSRPEYQESESLLERITREIDELLADLIPGVSPGGAMANILAWFILALFVAVIVALVVWAVRAGGWGRSSRLAKQDAVILASQEHRTTSDWLDEAIRHESEGRWREGLLCRYRALVTELVRRGVIAELAGRTAGEFLQEVAQRQDDLVSTFRPATELFEEAWYGGVETGPDERDRFAALADAALAQLAHLVDSGHSAGLAQSPGRSA